MQGISWLLEQLMAYQEGLCSTESLLLGTRYYYDQIKGNQFTQQAHKCQTYRRLGVKSKWEYNIEKENRKICHKHMDWSYWLSMWSSGAVHEDSNAAGHKFSKILGATPKFYMPEKWYEAHIALRAHNSGVTCCLTLVLAACALMHITVYGGVSNSYVETIRHHHAKFGHPSILPLLMCASLQWLMFGLHER